MPSRDLIRCLQSDALRVAAAIAPGVVAAHVVALDGNGKVIFKLPVPPAVLLLAAASGAAPADEPPAVAPGWAVGPRGVLYDGARVAVAPSRLKLLRVLVEADGPLAAKELASMAFDRETDEGNARYHVGELRKELKTHFPDFEGDVIRPTGAGYELVLR